MEIKPYVEADIRDVQDFNARLKVAQVPSQFPENHVPRQLRKTDDSTLYREYFVLRDSDGVHGGYILGHQDFYVKGQVTSIAHYQLPLSEGIIDKRYTVAGIQLLRDALDKQPLLYALGMGGHQIALPKMLKAAKWNFFDVPFLFRINNPVKFFKNIVVLRTTQTRRFLLDFLALTRFASLPIKLMQRFLTKPTTATSQLTEGFGTWADELWDKYKDEYHFSAVRTARILNALYAENDPRFLRLRICQGPVTIGWAVVINTQMVGHRQFGNMRIGSIVDCFAHPENAHAVISCATKFLQKLNVDLILSNQSHIAWVSALKNAGFLSGPTNFILAVSPELASRLQPFEKTVQYAHINRGDGDGPIHL